MLRKVAIIIPLLLAAIGLLSWQSETYVEYCDEAEQCADRNLLIYGWLNLADFFETFEAAFVVLSTIAVAAFTFTLWRSTSGLWTETKGLAKLAADQGEAFLKAERPYVFLHISSSGVEIVGNGEFKFAGHRFRCSFENHGRTVAFLTELKEHFIVVEGMIDAPEPMDPMVTRGRLLPVGTTATATTPFNIATNLMNTDATAMQEEGSWKDRRLFFQGFVRFSDSFRKHYITGFLACFSPSGNAWVLRGDEEYNYTREEDPKTIPEWKGST